MTNHLHQKVINNSKWLTSLCFMGLFAVCKGILVTLLIIKNNQITDNHMGRQYSLLGVYWTDFVFHGTFCCTWQSTTEHIQNTVTAD